MFFSLLCEEACNGLVIANVWAAPTSTITLEIMPLSRDGQNRIIAYSKIIISIHTVYLVVFNLFAGADPPWSSIFLADPHVHECTVYKDFFNEIKKDLHSQKHNTI